MLKYKSFTPLLFIFFSTFAHSTDFDTCFNNMYAYYTDVLYHNIPADPVEAATYVDFIQVYLSAGYDRCLANNNLVPQDIINGIPGFPTSAPPPTHPDFPFLSEALAASLALAAGLLAGLAAFAAAPTIVPALALATALTAGLMAMPFSSEHPSITPTDLETVPPIKVKLAPSPSPSPNPDQPGGSGSGAPGSPNAPGAPPAVETSTDGKFIPIGSKPYTSATDGGWEKTESKQWAHRPPSTPDNPTPAPDVIISPDGTTVTQVTRKNSSGQPLELLTITRSGEKQTTITQSANVPVSGPDGNPTLAQVHRSTTYQGTTGASSTPVAAPVTRVNPKLADGTTITPTSGVTPLTPAGGTGGGTTGGTGGTTGGTGTSPTGGGDCPGCAKESTQLSNNAHLKSINDFFKGDATSSTIPNAKAKSDFDNIILQTNSPIFSSLVGFKIPNHRSDCPTPGFRWNSQDYYFTAHCQLVIDHFGILRSVFITIYAVSALFIVLKA